MHRDIKPENILVGQDSKVRLCDFGLTKNILEAPFTQYVSTRWYRAPELLISAKKYGPEVDIFALGCVIAELFRGEPLFAGTSEQDQLHRVLSTLGTPSWTEFEAATRKLGLPHYTKQSLQALVPTASADAVDLLEKMLAFNPRDRISARKYT